MAVSSTVTSLGSEICTALVAKAKQYRLDAINARITAAKTTAGGTNRANYLLEAKKAKITSDDASTVWAFATTEVNDGLLIRATAPSDRGGYTKDWGYIDKDGKIAKDTSVTPIIDLTDTATKDSFKNSMTHLGTHW
tara:strand:+ start:1134 stop:1544 length:411 start_codon:yes stop_codon:yes gene_type:complete